MQAAAHNLKPASPCLKMADAAAARQQVVTLCCDEEVADEALRAALMGIDWAAHDQITFDLTFVSRGNANLVWTLLDFLCENPGHEDQLVIAAAEPLASYLKLCGVDQVVPVIAGRDVQERFAA